MSMESAQAMSEFLRHLRADDLPDVELFKLKARTFDLMADAYDDMGVGFAEDAADCRRFAEQALRDAVRAAEAQSERVEASRSSYRFTDPVSGHRMMLVINGPDANWFDRRSGVLHDDCHRLADVSPDLDAFYCPVCKRNGRLSGGWAMQCLRNHRGEVRS